MKIKIFEKIIKKLLEYFMQKELIDITEISEETNMINKTNNSKKNDFSLQIDNVRNPFNACFSTAMINAARTVDIKFPQPTSKDDKFSQDEDRYDLFIYSDEITSKVDQNPEVRSLLAQDYDYREIYAVQEYAFNKWIGKQVCKFINYLSLVDVISILDRGGSVIISGKFYKFSHVVTIVGYITNNNKLTHLIIDDSYGNPLKEYNPIGVDGNDIEYPVEDFWKATDKGNGLHFGIVFLPNGEIFSK